MQTLFRFGLGRVEERSRDSLGALPPHANWKFMHIALSIYSPMPITRSFRNFHDRNVRAIASKALNRYAAASAFQEKTNDFMALHQA
jgi:hypothetical protein